MCGQSTYMPETSPSPPRRRGRPPASQPGEPAPQRVDAVERALTILEAFDAERPSLSLAELADRTRLYPSTALRLAGSLLRFGYLHRGRDGRFRIGPAPLRLGALYRQAFQMADYVRPVLAHLVAATDETAAFYVRDGARRVCLYRHHTPRLIRHHLEEGSVLPLDRGASAHVLTAFGDGGTQEAVRRQGYAVSLGERDPETAAIAAPVFGPARALAGALGITGLLTRFQAADLPTLAGIVMAAADGLTQELGGVRPA